MLERLHIRNYRVFNDLTINQLSRINLIAGKNNSGKTSLLEAIFLLTGAGNPHFMLNMRGFRWTDSGTGMAQTELEAFWKPIFSALDTNKTVEIIGHHTSVGRLALTIMLDKPRTTELPLSDTVRTRLAELSNTLQLMLSFSSRLAGEVKGHIRVTGQSVQLESPNAELPFLSTFLSSRMGNPKEDKEDAVLLGVLRKRKQGHLLLEALRVIEPRLQSIEENSASGEPLIWGDIGLSELVPLPFMGEGMIRVARLVLAISTTPNGVVLADEIENGLHHSVLPKVWKVVDTVAKQFNTQIFATTHSFECIEAAQPFLCSGDFRLHRLEVSGTENRCVTFKPNGISAAIRHNLEVR